MHGNLWLLATCIKGLVHPDPFDCYPAGTEAAQNIKVPCMSDRM